MIFDFNLKSSFLFIFFVHGLVFFVLLFEKGIKGNHKPSLWLSFFTILCVLYILPFMLGYAGWYSKNPYRDILFYIPFQQLFLLPPVLYFYFKALLSPSIKLQKIDYFHFIPAIFYLIYSFIIFFTDKILLSQYYFYEDGRDKDFSFSYQATGFISLLIYLMLSLRIYNKYKANTYNTYSYADSIILKWAQQFLIAFLLLLIIRALFFVINPEWAKFGQKFWYYILFSILFYYVSIKGYFSSIRSITSLGALPVKLINDTEYDPISDINYFNVKSFELTNLQDLENWKLKIEKLMVEEQIFTNPALSTLDIAQKIETHPKKISQVVNQAFDMNFNDYINQYRANAIIEKIKKGEHSKKTLLGIAMDCGFNSKSTFNRAFRKHTSMSPKEFIQKLSNESVSNQDLRRFIE